MSKAPYNLLCSLWVTMGNADMLQGRGRGRETERERQRERGGKCCIERDVR